MIDPRYQEIVPLEASLLARYHLQLEIVERQEDGSVRARVRRLFRAHGKLRVGDEVSFQVPVFPPSSGADPVCLSPDFNNYGTAVTVDQLMSARYIEAFLERKRGKCWLASDQYCLLGVGGLSDSPLMRVPTRAEVEAAYARAGLRMGSWPPCPQSDDDEDEDAVLYLLDQDNNRTSSPRQFPKWLPGMKPGGSLTFVHKDGGRLVVNKPVERVLSSLQLQCLGAGGDLLAEAVRWDSHVVEIIKAYIAGETPQVVAEILRVDEASLVAPRPGFPWTSGAAPASASPHPPRPAGTRRVASASAFTRLWRRLNRS